METQKLTPEAAARIITSKGVISTPGTFRTKCTNVTPYVQIREGGLKQVGIANFAAKTPYHETESARLFAQGEFDAAANQGLSHSLIEGKFTPAKGQMVDIVVEEITTNNGVTGLVVTDVIPAPVEQPVKRSMEDFFKMAGVTADGEEVSALAGETATPFKEETVKANA